MDRVSDYIITIAVSTCPANTHEEPKGRGKSLLLFLDLGTRWGEWSVSRSDPRERTPGTHWIGGWMVLRAGVDTEARGKVLYLFRGSNPYVKSVLTERPQLPK
jgi:hypothetical protein